ncbi:L,D-transpeptidase family protein [Luteolibacter algae]|uniref:L,D-transpeptidase family protein n=1 Tax=Luteolibacter algae TaxID=454151 RepID=A0ABW5D9C3_9BACT
MKRGITRLLLPLIGLILPLTFASCGSSRMDERNKMIVSVRDQKLLLVRDGKPVKSYPVSTSKFGVGDIPNSNRTPLGRMKVAKKIGGGEPAGAVFKSRQPTGEVLKPNAPGRDPIVSRILWLTGTESNNKNAFRRFIYIHGTPEVNRLGTPASYGCIRMGTTDVVDLYNRVGTGAEVYVIRGSLKSTTKQRNYTAFR